MGEDEARELELFITNDADLYRQRHEPIIANLSKKKYKGVYNHDKAITLMMYLVDDGAKKYFNQFGSSGFLDGGSWNIMFDKPTRLMVAKELVDSFETEFGYGNYSGYKQKYLVKPVRVSKAKSGRNRAYRRKSPRRSSV